MRRILWLLILAVLLAGCGGMQTNKITQTKDAPTMQDDMPPDAPGELR